MVAYLIKFILCSGFLFSFYKVFLERESMYKINRFYLLIALLFSLLAPLYKINLPITMEETKISPELLTILLANPELLKEDNSWTFGEIMNIIYFIIGFGLLARFFFNIFSIIYKIKIDEKIKMNELTFVLDQKADQPFSFLNFIFLPKNEYENIHANLIQHEKAHCIQKHSWDILFIELFQIVFWFNPFLYWYKKSIKLNHEFLADEYVLQNDVDVKMYQHQILDCIATEQNYKVASHFNFILTKKRLLMMTKQTSKRKIQALSFATFPFIFSAFILFSQKSFAKEVEKSAKTVEKNLDKKINQTIKEVRFLNEKFIEKDTIKNRIFIVDENDSKDFKINYVNKDEIKSFSIDSENQEATVNLKSGEIKKIKITNPTTLGEFKIFNKKSFNIIDSKDIKSIDVNKKNKAITVIKTNGDSIKYNMNFKFDNLVSDSLQSIINLKTNSLLTENLKNQLKELYPEKFKSFEISTINGIKKVKIDGKEYSFPEIDFKFKDLSDEEKRKIEETIKNKNYTFINTYTNSSRKKDFQTKEEIKREVDKLKAREKETKRLIKELEKQQRKLN